MFRKASFSECRTLLHCGINVESSAPQRTRSRRIPAFKRVSEVIMKSKLIAALLLATSATLAAPAFASGYGPAPFYRPEVGAPSSQSGPNTQTLAAEQNNAAAARSDVGGVAGGTVEGARSHSVSERAQAGIDNVYRGQ
jgi:hypothetical protein